jgi:hypothetical protein
VIHHAQKLNALLPLWMSLKKQPIQILYYLTQFQMTSNNMYIVQIVVILIFAIWLSLWFGQLCSRGHGTRCQGVQFNEKWTKIPMAMCQCGTPRLFKYVLWTVLWSFFLFTISCYCWHNLGTVWLLFYYWTSKLINVLLSPFFFQFTSFTR